MITVLSRGLILVSVAVTLAQCASSQTSSKAVGADQAVIHSREEGLAEGDRAFAERDDFRKAEKAIQIWKQVLALSDGFDVRVRLAQAEYFVALNLSGSQRKEHFAHGAEEALRALGLSGTPANDVCAKNATFEVTPALFWRAENLDGFSREAGLVASTLERKTALCLARRAAELNPNYFHAGPLRLLGRILSQTPALAGGNTEQSRKAFADAFSIAPDFLFNFVDFAATCAIRAQDRKAFDDALEAALTAKPDPPEIAPENRLARKRAQELKAQVRTFF